MSMALSRLFGGRQSNALSITDRALVEALDRSNAIIWFDVDGTIREANQNFLDAMCYTAAEIVGQHHRMFVTPEMATAPEYQAFWRKLAAGEHATGEFPRRGKGGRTVWIEASYCPFHDAKGEVAGVVKIASDITQRKMDALDAQGQIEAISRAQAVIEFTPDGDILTANENFLGAMGYTLAEIKGKHHRIFMDPEEAADSAYRAFWQGLRQGDFKGGDFRRRDKAGQDVWIRASYNPVFGADGVVVKVVKVATDITQMRQCLANVAAGLEALSGGDLQNRIEAPADPLFEPLVADFNASLARLGEVIGRIKGGGLRISDEGETLMQSNSSFAERAQEQAGALEEAAASLEEISAAVEATSDKARSARQASDRASAQSERGEEVVRTAIDAMDGVEKSAGKITAIIDVIDAIAFQTNLLALNAAVEAARAGDAGKGFAVVASEVRSLAQRSAEAAKDITQLIKETSTQVESGAHLVRETGSVLSKVDEVISTMVRDISEITGACEEQSQGLADISQAVNMLDKTNQMTAEMAQDGLLRAKALLTEAGALADQTRFFQTEPVGGQTAGLRRAG